MVIVGAKGFAKEVCEVLLQLNYSKKIAILTMLIMIYQNIYLKNILYL